MQYGLISNLAKSHIFFLVFQASTMKGQTMIMIGFLMNIVCVTFTNVWIHFTGEYFFNEDFDGIPDWITPGQNYNLTRN